MIQRPIDARRGDDGFTLIEVVVAILVFAIVSTGVVAGLTTVIRMTADNRARIVAANLASQDIDLVRAIDNPFEVSNASADTFLNGTAFTVTRSVKWVSNAGSDLECVGGSTLLYLRVNVRVTWDGMLPMTSAVQDDTLLAPEGRTSSSGTGSIAIQVDDAAGNGVSGADVLVTADPSGTGAAVSKQPADTTADGCTYVTQVTPGTYVVTATRTGFVDPTTGSAKATATVAVQAGESASAALTLTPSGKYAVRYVPSPVTGVAAPALPTNLSTTFVSSAGTVVTKSPSATVSLPSGNTYTAVAGEISRGTTTCAAADPLAWRAGTVNGVPLKQGVRAGAKGSAFEIPVGVVEVSAPLGGTIRAVRSTGIGATDPGCDIDDTVLVYAVKGKGLLGRVPIALPYGSWRITGAGLPVLGPMLRSRTNAATTGITVDGLVTVDPRSAG